MILLFTLILLYSTFGVNTQWFRFLDNARKYSVKNVADTLLDFMKSYIKHGHCNDMFMPALFTSFADDRINAKPAPSPAA